MPLPQDMDDDLLFEQSYLIDVLPDDTVGLGAVSDSDANLPAALASAAYGYARKGQFSPLYAGVFGFAGYTYPLLSAVIIAADALFNQPTPAGSFLKSQYAKHSPKLSKRLGLGEGPHSYKKETRKKICTIWGRRSNGRKYCMKYGYRYR